MNGGMGEATEQCPVYEKYAHEDSKAKATPLFFVTCNEGWRLSIVCEGMYEWAADWLINEIQGKPYAPGRNSLRGQDATFLGPIDGGDDA